MIERDPFRIEGPAVISFSGGRTSAYMLWRILDAYNGALPDGVVVEFSNTGKEMGETLDFIDECSRRWCVPIIWLEYDATNRYRVVTLATCSRQGEPFKALIGSKQFLPNPTMRFCTQELKIRVMKRYTHEVLGFKHWDMAIGFRADEPRRVAKLSIPSRERFERFAPLAAAGVTKQEVGRFWDSQPFDLRLPNMNGQTMHGNCDLCFLKGADQIVSLMREEPSRAVWWLEAEAEAKKTRSLQSARFRKDRPSYADLLKFALSHDDMYPVDNELQDCACTD